MATAYGVLTGLILFLACAVVGVIAANGADNSGFARPGSAAAGGSAEPRPAAPARGSSLQALDLDGDGRLSLAEAAGNREIVTRFNRADRDKDGRLTPAEFERLAGCRRRRRPRGSPGSGGVGSRRQRTRAASRAKGLKKSSPRRRGPIQKNFSRKILT